MGIVSLRIKFPERETDRSFPYNAEDKFVELYLYSALYIHGLINNEVDGVWEYGAKEDIFDSKGQDKRDLEKTT
jgi:hypothetical protein